jgi:hypothetical protein
MEIIISLGYILSHSKYPFRKKCQTKNLPGSDPDLNSSSLVRFGLKFDHILHHIQDFTGRRMLNVIAHLDQRSFQ